ncbi:MAG: hypothetical protein FGM32_08375 [Candidatus Kapabacteria bacterium]|nr:hypothetical protein [Candidatus Kapabacteria bacterium]
MNGMITRHICNCILLLLASLSQMKGQSDMLDHGRIGHAGFLTSVVTDYQCLSINPANLGFAPTVEYFTSSTPLEAGLERKTRRFAVGFGQVGASIRSDALDKTKLFDMVLQRGSAVEFTREDQIQLAKDFSDRGIRVNADVMLVGASYQTKRWGGIGFTIRDRVGSSFQLNDGASDLIFRGRNASYFDSSYVNWRGDTIGVARKPQLFSQLFDGTQLSLTWSREYAVAYGLPLFMGQDWRFCIGVTGKYLESYAYMDARAENGVFSGASALSPWFEINYGKATTPSALSGTGLLPVGRGYGIDFGVSYQSSNFSLGMSVIDIGQMRYNGNVYSIADTVVNGLATPGFESYNFIKEAQQLTGEGNYIVWSGLLETRAMLPTRVRLGGSYTVSRFFRCGFDVMAPLTDVGSNLSNAITSVGINYRPFSWLIIAAGLGTGDGMTTFIPGSIALSILGGTVETGVTTMDMSSLFTDRLPVISAHVGFIRLRL